MCIHREIHTIWKRHNDFETAQTMEFIRFAETETSLFFEKYTHLGSMQSPNRDAKTMEFKGFVKSETCVFTEKSTQFGTGVTILRLRFLNHA